MPEVVDLQKARWALTVKRGYRNWRTQFGEEFGVQTRCSTLTDRTLALLAQGKDKSTFFFFDLVMTLEHLGSGFEFNALNPKEKMAVMDRYLFLLDHIRYEYMKRLGWLAEFPGEEFSLVELVTSFDELAPRLQAQTPLLSPEHPAHAAFTKMNAFEREEFIRKMIPAALKEIENHSTTL